MNQIKSETEAEKFIAELDQNLPVVFPRADVQKLTGGVINGRTLANKMALGIGPKAIRVGGKVVLVRRTFIAWLLEGNLENIK